MKPQPAQSSFDTWLHDSRLSELQSERDGLQRQIDELLLILTDIAFTPTAGEPQRIALAALQRSEVPHATKAPAPPSPKGPDHRPR